MTPIHRAISRQLALARLILISLGAALMSGLLAVSCAARGLSDPGIADLVAQLTPSVVNITTTRYKDIQIPTSKSVMAQVAEPDKSIWYGSGFIVSTDGVVLTNKHVVHNGVDFRITMSDGQQFPADLTGESVCCDIALLTVRYGLTGHFPSSSSVIATQCGRVISSLRLVTRWITPARSRQAL